MTPEERAAIVLTHYRKELHASIAHPLELGRYITDAIRTAVEEERAAQRDELTLLRELVADVDRWRESSDVRDLRYILETMDEIEQMKGNDQ